MLKRIALNATLWSGADIFLRQGLQFMVSVVLAHLLTPKDFGVVALLALFTGIANAFVDGGFSAALIQNQSVNRDDESTVFWFNLAIGTAIALILWCSAQWIAIFYKQPVLVPLMTLMSVNVFLGAAGAIHRTLLSKQLNFRLQMKVGVVATIISGSAAIAMAWVGYGVWALAAQIIVTTGVSTGLLWLWNPWRPAWVFNEASARKLFGFGGYHFISSLLDITYMRLYTLLIGRFYGARDLGLYNNADTMQQLPGGFLTGVLARVAFPMFSAASDDKLKLRRGTQLAVRGMMLMNVPMMLGMMALADPLVHVLFGTQWLAAVPVLRVLCFAGLFWPLQVINLNVLMAQGYSHLMLRLEAVKKAMGVLLICIGAYFGLIGIAWSQVVLNVIGFAINTHYSKKFIDYGAGTQFIDFLPLIGAASVMAGMIYSLSIFLHVRPLYELLILIPFGAILFFAIAWLSGLQAFRDVVALLGRVH